MLNTSIKPESTYLYPNQTYVLVDGLYYGSVLLIVLFALIADIQTKETGFAYYALFLFFGIGSAVHIEGYSAQLLWPQSDFLGQIAIPLFLALSWISFIQYCRHFLELKRESPRIDFTCRLMVVYFVVCLAMLVIGSLELVFLLLFLLLFLIAAGSSVPILLVIVAALRMWRRGNTVALYFLICWSGYMAVILVLNALNFIKEEDPAAWLTLFRINNLFVSITLYLLYMKKLAILKTDRDSALAESKAKSESTCYWWLA